MPRIRVLHISTAHQPQDPRIVFKQCQTLAETYDVYCAIPQADPTVAPSIRFIRLPYFRLVIWRILITCPYILLRCLWLRPKLIHVYVPEFLPFTYVFRLFGAKVIYEVQENLHKKIHLKTYNRGRILEKMFRWFDNLAQRHCYMIFTEHGYLDTYRSLVKPYVVVYNYPDLQFIEPFYQPYAPSQVRPSFFYIGWLSFERAFDTLLESLNLLRSNYPNFTMHLFGRQTFTTNDLGQLPAYAPIRNNLHFYGYKDQRNAFLYAKNTTAGIALLKPIGDYPESYTTKLFEYMALGLPVITSDFPLYKAIVERHQCGFCVSPYEPQQICDALTYLIQHSDQAQAMGLRGRNAVKMAYNWSTEAEKLTLFYQKILSE